MKLYAVQHSYKVDSIWIKKENAEKRLGELKRSGIILKYGNQWEIEESNTDDELDNVLCFRVCTLFDAGCPHPTVKGESCYGLPNCWK